MYTLPYPGALCKPEKHPAVNFRQIVCKIRPFLCPLVKNRQNQPSPVFRSIVWHPEDQRSAPAKRMQASACLRDLKSAMPRPPPCRNAQSPREKSQIIRGSAQKKPGEVLFQTSPGINCRRTLFLGVSETCQRTIRQADSARDFSSSPDLKSAGLAEKIRRSAKTQLCGAALNLQQSFQRHM